ncbi:MAG: hypothetical protein ACRDRL_19000 [Sciscionella sp.]
MTKGSGDVDGEAPSVRLHVFSHADAFGDYVVSVDDSGLPQGVTLTKLVS